MIRDLIVIPARWGSTRLPGKPLIVIAGRTLLERVVNIAARAASKAEAVFVLVATDDERVAAHARDLGVKAVITSSAITTGSGRALAAARLMGSAVDHVVNLQGDAPFASPHDVAAILAGLRAAPDAVVTPVVRLSWPALDALRTHKRSAPFSGTTCIVDPHGRALWFSKAVMPAIRDEAVLRTTDPLSPVHQHVGIYGYRLDALARFEQEPPSRYERMEGLEQLRFLELGMTIRTVPVPPPAFAATGIDTVEDVARAEAMIAAHGDPFDR